MRSDPSTMARALTTRALTVASAAPVISTTRPLVDLSTSEPPATPEHIRQAAHAALDRGETHYTAAAGITELRDAIAVRSSTDGFPASADGTIVTNGGTEAIYLALQCALKPDDRVLIGCPLLPTIVEMIEFIGAHVVELPLAPPRFAPHPDHIRSADAALLVLASPSPITGLAIPNDELTHILQAARDAGIAVLLDRSAAWCTYHQAPEPFADSATASGVMTTGSFSVAYALAGWRVGYLSAPPERMAALRGLKVAMSICTSPISQHAALAALSDFSWLKARRAQLAARRDALIPRLQARGLDPLRPDAFPSLLIDTRRIDADDRVVAGWLAEQAGFAVTPASDYGQSLAGFLRLNLGMSQAAYDAFIAYLDNAPAPLAITQRGGD